MSPRTPHTGRHPKDRIVSILLLVGATGLIFAACSRGVTSPASSPVYSDSALDGVPPRDVTISSVDAPEERQVEILSGENAGGAPSALRVLDESPGGAPTSGH